MLSQERLKELLTYDEATGEFHWNVNRGKVKAGDKAGCVHVKRHRRYIQIVIDWKHYSGHSLAALYMTGSFQENEVDHIDGDGTNNAWDNLRDVPHRINQRNCRRSSDNTSGVTGVSWRKDRNRWRAYIATNNGVKHVGNFISFDDAVSARKTAERECGYHENHGSVRSSALANMPPISKKENET